MNARVFSICTAVTTTFSPTLFAQPCVSEWTTRPIGNPGIVGVVNHLLVWNDGTGPAVYASGYFTSAGNAAAVSVAKWDGLQWSELGSGLTRNGSAHRAPGLAVHDDGTGEALYATGSFDSAGGTQAAGIARWDGSSWSPVGSGIVGQGFKMTSYDDGHGSHLYLGGKFTIGATISNLARWDGTQWESVGTSDESVNTLTVYDDGSGPALFIGGNMRVVGGTAVSGVAKYQGGTWTSPGAGVTGGKGRVNSLVPYDDGTGTKLFAGGDFLFAGISATDNIAAWTGSDWERIPAGGPDGAISVMATYHDGNQESLYIGGPFFFAGPTEALSIASYNGSFWSPLAEGITSSGITSVTAMTTFNDQSLGRSLLVGGGFETAGTLATESVAIWGGCNDCYADCDQTTGVGVLDIFDFLCFQTAFVNNDPYACECDTSSPTRCDIFDFLCFQDAFVSGCP